MLRGPEGGTAVPSGAPVLVHCRKKVAGAQRYWSLVAGTGTSTSVPTSASMTSVLSRWLDLGFLGVGDGVARHLLDARAPGSTGSIGTGFRGQRKQPGERTGQSSLADLDPLEDRGARRGVNGAEDRGFDIEVLPRVISVDFVAHEEASERGRSPPRAGLRHRRGQRENPHRCQHTQHRFAFHDVPSLLVRFGSPVPKSSGSFVMPYGSMVTSCLALNARSSPVNGSKKNPDTMAKSVPVGNVMPVT